MKTKIIRTFLSLLTLPIIAVISILFLTITGCDEGMNIAGDVIMESSETPDLAMTGEVKQPDPIVDDEVEQSTDDRSPPEDVGETDDDEAEQTKPEDPPELDIPSPTVSINTAVQEENGSVTVSGTSTDLSEGETVTVTLADMIVVAAVVDEAGNWKATVSAADTEQLIAGTVTVVAAAAGADPADSSFEYTPAAAVSTGTPAWLIPPPNTTLSERERELVESDQLINYDAVTGSMTELPTGKPADQIGALPYKDREEVYEQFIRTVEVELPFFREAAEYMKEVNINLGILAGTKGVSSTEYKDYKEIVDIERGLHHTVSLVNIDDLEDIYFEENLEDRQYIGDTFHGAYSRYWIILEYYRLRLEYPDLAERLRERKAGSYFKILELFRKSVQEGYVFGLDNPWR